MDKDVNRLGSMNKVIQDYCVIVSLMFYLYISMYFKLMKIFFQSVVNSNELTGIFKMGGTNWGQKVVGYKVDNSWECITYGMAELSFIDYVRNRQDNQLL